MSKTPENYDQWTTHRLKDALDLADRCMDHVAEECSQEIRTEFIMSRSRIAIELRNRGEMP